MTGISWPAVDVAAAIVNTLNSSYLKGHMSVPIASRPDRLRQLRELCWLLSQEFRQGILFELGLNGPAKAQQLAVAMHCGVERVKYHLKSLIDQDLVMVVRRAKQVTYALGPKVQVSRRRGQMRICVESSGCTATIIHRKSKKRSS